MREGEVKLVIQSDLSVIRRGHCDIERDKREVPAFESKTLSPGSSLAFCESMYPCRSTVGVAGGGVNPGEIVYNCVCLLCMLPCNMSCFVDVHLLPSLINTCHEHTYIHVHYCIRLHNNTPSLPSLPLSLSLSLFHTSESSL